MVVILSEAKDLSFDLCLLLSIDSLVHCHSAMKKANVKQEILRSPSAAQDDIKSMKPEAKAPGHPSVEGYIDYPIRRISDEFTR